MFFLFFIYRMMIGLDLFGVEIVLYWIFVFFMCESCINFIIKWLLILIKIGGVKNINKMKLYVVVGINGIK